jgi:hypothetical protein
MTIGESYSTRKGNIMATLGSISFKGKSGKGYTFEIYPLSSSWNSVSAVYIVTRRIKNQSDGYTHSAIYIGETGNLKERFSNHHKYNCFIENSANCLCILIESNEQNRLTIESDLLGNYNPPCNG